MNANEFDRLVNSVLDGSASEDERAALERHLSAEPAARAQLAAWEGMFSTLAAVPEPEVPNGLRQQILAAVRRADRPAPAWRRALESLVARRPTMALAYAGAFGLIAGSVISLMAIGGIGRDARLAPTSGTMTPPVERAPATPLGRGAIEMPGARVEAVATHEDGTVRFAVARTGDVPADVTIAFDPAGLGVVSVAPPGGDATVVVGNGRIEVTAFAAGPFDVHWRTLVSRPAPVVMTVRAGGHEGRATIGVTENAVQPSPGP